MGSEIEQQCMFGELEHYGTIMYTVGVLSRNRYEWIILDIASMIYNFSIVPIPSNIETYEL